MKLLPPLFLLLLYINVCWAQPDTLQHRQDSLLDSQLDHAMNRIHQLSAERLADSLRRVDLQRQVTQLSDDRDHVKRTSLLKQLTALRQQDSLRLARQKHQIDSLRRFVKGFPVTVGLDTLFRLYTRQGSFTPSERAAAVTHRLQDLAADYAFKPDSLKLIRTEQSVDLLYQERLLMSLSEQDALWAERTQQQLADQYRAIVASAVSTYQQQYRWQTLLKESLLALLVILGVVLFIVGMGRLFTYLLGKVRLHSRWFTRGVYIKSYELLNGEQQLTIIQTLFTLVRWALILLIVSLALPVIFGLFPFTKAISVTLLGYILHPLHQVVLSIWHYIPNLITILVLIIIFRYVLRFFAYLKAEIEKERLKLPGFYADWANPTYQILRALILAFMLTVIFPYLPGSDSPIFKGVSVFVGVLFTFGSAGALSNVVAGLVLTYMRAFKLGDRVKINEVTGDVIEKNLLTTRVRTIQNEIISIPNSMVMGNFTVNYSSDAQANGLIIHTTVTIGYDVPWRQVHQLLIAAAQTTPLIELTPVPYVLQTSLDDYYVSYRINAFTKEPNTQAKIYSDLHQQIQDHFFAAGVEIMSPHYKAVRDGNTSAIPPEYLPKDVPKAAFEVRVSKPEAD